MMDKLEAARRAAEELAQAEKAKQPYQAQIDQFMQDVDAPMDQVAQETFEDWAMCRNATNKAFRRAGMTYDESWSAADYLRAAKNELEKVW
jgi:hypothetical protein